MNRFEPTPSLPTEPDLPADWDRLADGELSDVQTRVLLEYLEQHPDEWRRCALAFIEAQTWRRDLSGLEPQQAARAVNATPAAAPLAGNTSPVQTEDRVLAALGLPPRKTTNRGQLFRSYLTIAAGFLLALGLGLAWRQFDAAHPGGRAPQLAGGPAAPASGTTIGQTSVQPGHTGPSGLTAPVVPPAAVAVEDQGTTRLETVRLSVDGQQGTSQQIDLPVLSGPGIDEQWLRNQPALVPQELLRLLQRTGQEIRLDRHLVPVLLDDGRRVLVPVDQIEVDRPRPRSFQ